MTAAWMKGDVQGHYKIFTTSNRWKGKPKEAVNKIQRDYEMDSES